MYDWVRTASLKPNTGLNMKMTQPALTRVRTVKTFIELAVMLAVGASLGLWTASLSTYSSCRGLCIIFLEPRFATWLCVVFGLSASGVLGALVMAVDQQLRRTVVRWIQWWTHEPFDHPVG